MDWRETDGGIIVPAEPKVVLPSRRYEKPRIVRFYDRDRDRDRDGQGWYDDAAAPYVSPFNAAGFTYVSARDVLTKAWTDAAGSTQHDGTDDGSVRRLEPTGGTLWDNQQNGTVDQFKYGNGDNSRAIGGKPVYYTEVDGISNGMASDAGASTILTANEFDLIIVINRLTTGTNKAILTLGTNAPLVSRMYTGNVVRAYGFLSGYVEANNSSFTVGSHVVHYRFEGSQLKVAVDGGAFATVSETAAWSPDTGKLQLGLGNYAFAEYGLYDGNYGDYATLVSDLMAEYSIS